MSDCHTLISSLLVCTELEVILSLSLPPASLGDEEGPICLNIHISQTARNRFIVFWGFISFLTGETFFPSPTRLL